MVVQNSGKYSSFICNNARTLGESVCANKQRILRSEVEALVLSNISERLLSPAIVKRITENVKDLVHSHVKAHKSDNRTLTAKKRSIQAQIGNLLDLAEKGEVSPALQERLAHRERELREIESDIENTQVSPGRTAEVTIAWITERLLNLQRLISDRESAIPVLRNELGNLFPQKLSVLPQKSQGRVGFEISGFAKPFNLLPPQNLSKRFIAVRGIEPRFDG